MHHGAVRHDMPSLRAFNLEGLPTQHLPTPGRLSRSHSNSTGCAITARSPAASCPALRSQADHHSHRGRLHRQKSRIKATPCEGRKGKGRPQSTPSEGTRSARNCTCPGHLCERVLEDFEKVTTWDSPSRQVQPASPQPPATQIR